MREITVFFCPLPPSFPSFLPSRHDEPNPTHHMYSHIPSHRVSNRQLLKHIFYNNSLFFVFFGSLESRYLAVRLAGRLGVDMMAPLKTISIG